MIVHKPIVSRLKNDSFCLVRKPIPMIPSNTIPINSLSFGKANGAINHGIKKHRKYFGDDSERLFIFDL
tara:strand:+ start:553 stop:759 length:207 start_codon:yes stop_codon:yes gene_type:complete